MPETPSSQVWKVGEFLLDDRQRLLLFHGQPVSLTPRQLDTLRYMVRNPGRLLTKEELLAAIWPDSFVEESNLSQNVFWLRKALRHGEPEDGAQRYIVTEPGKGYRFVAAVSSEPEPAPEPASPASASALTGASSPGRVSASTSWRLGIGVVACVLLIAAGALWRRHHRRLAEAAALPPVHVHRLSGDDNDPPIMVVLADPENVTPDASLTQVMNVLVRRELRQSPQVGVLSRAWINKTLGYMQLPLTTPMSVDNALAVCRRYNANAVLHAMLATSGTGYHIALDALNCVTGQPIFQRDARVDDEDHLLAALDSLLPDMRLALGESQQSVREFSVTVENATTGSMEAFHAFLDAENLRLKGESQAALPLYEKAARLDPNFSMNWAAMASVFYTTGQAQRARETMQKAYETSGRISAHEQFMIRTMYTKDALGDWPAALPLIQEWARLYPTDPSALTDESSLLVDLGRFDEAYNVALEGHRRFPADGLQYVTLLQAAIPLGRYSDAKHFADDAIANHLDGWSLHERLWQWAILTGNDAVAARQPLTTKGTSDEYSALSDGIYVLLRQGRLREAEAAMPAFVAAAEKQHSQESIDATRGAFAFTCFLDGEDERARALLARYPATTPSADYSYAAALVGNEAAVARTESQLANIPQQNTFVRSWQLPIVHAALDEARNDNAEALTALKPTDVIALHDFWPSVLRARAYLALSQPTDAARALETVTRAPGIDTFSPIGPILHLELARARAASNDRQAARTEYDLYLAAMSHADPGLPIVDAARQERRRL